MNDPDATNRRAPVVVGARSPVPARQDPASERQTMDAWERLITGEALAPMAVSNVVLASWQRSMRSSVEPRSRAAPLAAGGDALERLRRQNQDMMWAAQGLFVASSHLLSHSGSIMLLTDPHGVVLDVAGDMRTLEAARAIHLVEGANWHEGVVGTNGIGTALATRQPVIVHAAEHFCEGIKHWTCAAAPVYRPDSDQIVGVVDISGPPSTYQRSNLALALAAARQIEAILAERASRDHVHLLEASLRFASRSEAAAMVVLDRHGVVIHIRDALPGLSLRLGDRLPGMGAALDKPVDEWRRHLPAELRPDWLHPVHADGRAIGALLVVPSRARRPGVSAGPQPDHAPKAARQGFGALLGDSPAMRTAVERAQQLAGRRVAVLIQGETGVGKELFARAIHGDEASRGPLVMFNCGATTKELIGSELFGHVRGAYTGATNEGRAGRFELAHGGTLCLDEIGELPLELQPVLLRALEEGVVSRLGEAKERTVDVRLIAMTNRDLLKEVAAGRFRRDLYHRISVTSIRVPPLRDRAADVELLTRDFNRRLAERHGMAPRQFGPDVLAYLNAYAWPGNVRELRNVVESLLLTSTEEFVLCNELPEELLLSVGEAASAAPLDHASSLEDAERQAIAHAVKQARGNLTQAARTLQVSRSTLYRKVERYRLGGLVQHTHSADPGAEA